tara:strand:- start:2595 stop:3749 length:1155 start_codon:yes stop_codon:yes gene_type:complete
MAQVAEGRLEINEEYVKHIDLCLACRACETACPSGVQYGRLVEAARSEIANQVRGSLLKRFVQWLVFKHLLLSPRLLQITGYAAYLYQKCGLQQLIRRTTILDRLGRIGQLERLAPQIERPFYFAQIGKVFPAYGEVKHRVAFLSGCIANISFARLNEATVRVLQRNGCEVTVAAGQGCCGALHIHAGLRDLGRQQALQNIEALEKGNYDAYITNAAGCGSVLKEYHELFEHAPELHQRAKSFSSKIKDVSEFLAEVDFNKRLGPLPISITYQDSCHLLHGQKIKQQPRDMLAAIPELTFTELPFSEICCGSAGVYNVEHTEMSMSLLHEKMRMVRLTGAQTIVTANPGCLLQMRAGVEMSNGNERVVHVVELLDESYRRAETN